MIKYMKVITLDETRFKILLTLCAHDFRHDFMNTSARVNAGLITGFNEIPPRRGGAKSRPTSRSKSRSSSRTKSREISEIKVNKNLTRMAIYMNDILFLDNLRALNTKKKKGKQKIQAILQAMDYSTLAFKLLVKFLDILTKNNRKKPKKGEKIRRNIHVKVPPSRLADPMGALVLKSKKSKKTKKDKKTKKPKKSKKPKKDKKTKKQKKKIKGGGTPNQEGVQLEFPLYIPLDDYYRFQTDGMGHGFSAVIPDDEILRIVEQYRRNRLADSVDGADGADSSEGIFVEENDLESFEAFEDYYINSEETDTYIKEIKKLPGSIVKTELVEELNKVIQEVAPRRSGRTKKAAYYGETVDERVYEDWNNKYDIYSEMYDIPDTNQKLSAIGETFSIKCLNDFDDLIKFSQYYSAIAKSTKPRINFNGFIQFLNATHGDDIVKVAVAPKLTSSQATIIKNFGKEVSKTWYEFIVEPATRSSSPTLTPPSRPETGRISDEDKLLAKMLHCTFSATSTDSSVLKMCKTFFGNNSTFEGRGNNTEGWGLFSSIINNAAQFKKYPDIFAPGVTEKCLAPSVLDAMSNCPQLTYADNSAIHIKVTDNSADPANPANPANYIEYELTDIKSDSCNLSFTFKKDGAEIKTINKNLIYKDKRLSVVKVLRELITKIAAEVHGSMGSTLEEKITKFGQQSIGRIKDIVLPIICLKLFGDLGQELLAVANNEIFLSNDRPSAIRYMLMKISKIEKERGTGEVVSGGGGGYFPNKTADKYYI